MGKPQKKLDAHASGYTVRLPEGFRPLLEQLSQKNTRPVTVEVQLAIIERAKAEGIDTDLRPSLSRGRPHKRKPGG